MRREESLKSLTILLRSSSSVTKMLKNDMLSYGLNPTEFAVLEVLYNLGEQSIQTVGDKVLLASSSITYVVDCLEEKELLVRVQNQKDKRVKLISLSKKGRKFMDEIFPKHSSLIEELFGDLSEEEIKILKKSLKTIGLKAKKMSEG